MFSDALRARQEALFIKFLNPPEKNPLYAPASMLSIHTYLRHGKIFGLVCLGCPVKLQTQTNTRIYTNKTTNMTGKN